MKKEFFTTHDGSFTLFIPEMNETYHSKFGAINEAMHVFIHSGLEQMNKPVIKILEIGFGTGLNAFLTAKFFFNQKRIAEIYYESIEKFPLEEEIYKKLNYAETDEENRLFLQMHQADWNRDAELFPGFVLHKKKTDLIDFYSDKQFDLVYFDAFAPNKQEELWTVEIFRNLYNHMNKKGILVTYSAKGQVRRNMLEAGFYVERIPGPPGKREMLRAVKN